MNRQRKVVITVTCNGLGMIVDTKAEELDLSAQPNLQPNLQPTCNNLATDTISRHAAIDGVKTLHEVAWKNWHEPTLSVNVVIDMIKDLSSAQPEIIRCKDCKWWSNDDYRECSSPNYDDGYVTPAGFYCGYAERRTDERTD